MQSLTNILHKVLEKFKKEKLNKCNEGYLKSIDGINLSDDDSATESTEGLSGSLANIAVSGNQGDLKHE